MMLSLIAAIDKNNVIGNKGKLPWRLPSDLKRFKAITAGHPVIMGRHTHESVGKTLPGRRNIVVTRQTDYVPSVGAEVAHSLSEALQKVSGEQEAFVIGGGELYREALPEAGRLYLTHVRAAVEGDSYFPAVDRGEWKEVSRENGIQGAGDEYDFDCAVYERSR